MQDKSIKEEVLEQIRTLAVAGFGFVAALAWNEAIQALFKSLLPQSKGLTAKFVYAILVTVIAVIVTARFRRLTERTQQD